MGGNECSCPRLRVGHEVTENRNWNPDCAAHGLTSTWWRSPEQVERRARDNARRRELQAKARALRNSRANDTRPSA